MVAGHPDRQLVKHCHSLMSGVLLPTQQKYKFQNKAVLYKNMFICLNLINMILCKRINNTG